MKAMILAAGLGKRLRPLTDTIPKPNLMVGNKSLIQRNIELLIQNGFDEIVINVFHLKSRVKDHVISKFPNTKITFSDEAELLGTGGGVKQALNYLGDESFLLINADICHEFKLDTLIMDVEYAHIVGVKNPDHNIVGDFSIDGSMVSINNSNNMTWSGISVINPKIFESFENIKTPYSIWNPVIYKYIELGKVSGEFFDGSWIDTGTIERLTLANKVFKDEN
jgi:MurNAc alpha-1-phosphate uridylyltransferase